MIQAGCIGVETKASVSPGMIRARNFRIRGIIESAIVFLYTSINKLDHSKNEKMAQSAACYRIYNKHGS